ncbi:hypothetical protein [Phytoactinopolyspora halotolerans]|uniref:Uncharacterized protein n=1 Tax=Phytoactinopolyspora halotolerans TaxID=1981512 RepID=A0A6L9S6W5_9ACTN|nr:hypothetical protein [Phytoactinopolyspora halotolerans]NED99729.1 hypothetical protein [Phytoactinopolyspora halotolerans]
MTDHRSARHPARIAGLICAILAAAIGMFVAAAPARATQDLQIAEPGARVDQIAERLRTDPLVVDRSMANGDVEAVREILHDEIAGSTYPAYVVLVHKVPGDDLPDVPGELATLIHRRVGEDGLYVVGIGDWVEAISPGLDGIDDLTLANAGFAGTEAFDSTPVADARAFLRVAPIVESGGWYGPEGEAAAAEISSDLGGDPLMNRTHVDFSETRVRIELTELGPTNGMTEDGALGLGFVVGAASAILAAVVFALVGTRSRSSAPRQPSDVSAARRRLRDALAVIDESQWNAADDVDPDLQQALRNAADAAHALQDSTDPADVVGAMVLAEYAADTSIGHRPAEPPRPCYLNPMHGEHSTTAPLPGDASSPRVPVCPRCELDLREGRHPDVLRLRQGRKVVPYYRRDDVWAFTGFGSLRADAADLVLAGARAGTALPGRFAHDRRR